RAVRLQRTFLVLAALAAVPLALSFGVEWKMLHTPITESVAGGLAILFSDPIVWLCCLAFFCHVPIEASVAAWSTTLMTNKGVSETSAASLLSLFWLAFMGSRLITALVLPEGANTTLVIALATLCIAFTLAIVLSRAAGLTCAMVVAAGLILGPISRR